MFLRSRRPHPDFVSPCLPTPSEYIPLGSEWAFEVKHDGYRFVVRKSGDEVMAFTRRGNEWSQRVPAITAALRDLPANSATIDGECVICRPDGIADFDRLRTALANRYAGSAFLYAFDLLE